MFSKIKCLVLIPNLLLWHPPSQSNSLAKCFRVILNSYLSHIIPDSLANYFSFHIICRIQVLLTSSTASTLIQTPLLCCPWSLCIFNSSRAIILKCIFNYVTLVRTLHWLLISFRREASVFAEVLFDLAHVSQIPSISAPLTFFFYQPSLQIFPSSRSSLSQVYSCLRASAPVPATIYPLESAAQAFSTFLTSFKPLHKCHPSSESSLDHTVYICCYSSSIFCIPCCLCPYHYPE